MARTGIGIEPKDVDLEFLGRDLRPAEHALVTAAIREHRAVTKRLLKAFLARAEQPKPTMSHDPEELLVVNRPLSGAEKRSLRAALDKKESENPTKTYPAPMDQMVMPVVREASARYGKRVKGTPKRAILRKK